MLRPQTVRLVGPCPRPLPPRSLPAPAPRPFFLPFHLDLALLLGKQHIDFTRPAGRLGRRFRIVAGAEEDVDAGGALERGAGVAGARQAAVRDPAGDPA